MANQENKGRVSHFPEHGPIAENGREVLLSLKNVDITFGKGEGAVKAVKDASFDIYKGETFSLVGESGSGKTTIGRAVIRVNPLANGEIQYKGVKISGKIKASAESVSSYGFNVFRNIKYSVKTTAGAKNAFTKRCYGIRNNKMSGQIITAFKGTFLNISNCIR